MIKKLIPILLVLLMFLSISAISAAEYNTTHISTSAKNVKNYVETNKKLPSTVKVNGTAITTPQFLYLLTKDVRYINSKIKTPIASKSVSKASQPAETLSSTTSITKSQYLKYASSIIIYVDKNKRAPNFITTSSGKKIRYENIVYSYSKILAYYKDNNRLPSSVTVKTWSAVTKKTVISAGPAVKVTKISSLYAPIWTKKYSNLGTVQKFGPFGTGSKKVALIIGVHPQEGITHSGTEQALTTLRKDLKNVKIWLYKVKVTKDINDYEKSRMNGQIIAQKIIVPDIKSLKPKLVVDVHGNRGLYATNDFIFSPTKGAISVSYANKIKSKTTYLKYHYVEGTSPDYVTRPIAKAGIPTLVFELYLNVNNYNKVMYNKCLQLVKALNSITYV